MPGSAARSTSTVPLPTNPDDVANKAYVDSKLNVFARVIKVADQTLSNSATMQNDDELFVALEANKVYIGKITLIEISTTVADFQYDLTLPAGATGTRTNNVTGAQTPDSMTNVTTAKFASGNAVNQALAFYFVIIMGGTAGNLQVRWAQNTPEVSDTKVLIGSSIVVYEET